MTNFMNRSDKWHILCISRTKCWLDLCRLFNLRSDKCQCVLGLDKRRGRTVGQMSVGQMSVGQMLVTQNCKKIIQTQEFFNNQIC